MDRSLKILMLNHEFPPVGGGGSPITFELSAQLVRMGHQVDVVTMHFGNLPRFETIDGINIYRTPAIRRRAEISYSYELATYLPGALFKTLALARKRKYDIIHCHFVVPGGPLALMLSKLTRIPYIITAHGSDIPGYNPDRFQLQHKFTKPILRSVCKNAKMVTSPSLYLKGLMLKNIGDYEITHIPNGIDLESFKLDLTMPKENIILSTGRLLKRKGFQTLIRAVHDIELPFEVHIAGDGPYRSQLEKLAEGSKTKIVFHGWLDKASDELLSLYRRACIYILASAKENASVSLLEAMAAQCAVITTNVSGCPETVGDAAFLIDFDDSDKLKDILLRLSKDSQLVEQYAQKAYARVTSNFSWDKIVADYTKVYIDE